MSEAFYCTYGIINQIVNLVIVSYYFLIDNLACQLYNEVRVLVVALHYYFSELIDQILFDEKLVEVTLFSVDQ